MKDFLLSAILIIGLTSPTWCEIIAKGSDDTWVMSQVTIRRADLVAQRKKLRDDKEALKSSFDARLAEIQAQIDAVSADINTIDNWQVSGGTTTNP